MESGSVSVLPGARALVGRHGSHERRERMAILQRYVMRRVPRLISPSLRRASRREGQSQPQLVRAMCFVTVEAVVVSVGREWGSAVALESFGVSCAAQVAVGKGGLRQSQRRALPHGPRRQASVQVRRSWAVWWSAIVSFWGLISAATGTARSSITSTHARRYTHHFTQRVRTL